MVLASATLTIMAAAIIAPSLPAMGEVYGEGVLVRLALTITSLAIALSAPVVGMVADRVGRTPLLTASLVTYAVAGTAGYFVDSLPVLLGTRTLLGLAVGGVMTSVSALITWLCCLPITPTPTRTNRVRVEPSLIDTRSLRS